MKTKIKDYFALLKNINFSKLWMAETLSLFGDYVFSISLCIWIYKITNSTLALSSSIFAQFLPRMLLAPLAAILIDHFNRKKLIIIGDILRGALLLLLLIVRSAEQLPIVYLVILLNSSITRVTRSAKASIIPGIITKDQLVKANSLRNFTESLVLIFAPLWEVF